MRALGWVGEGHGEGFRVGEGEGFRVGGWGRVMTLGWVGGGGL